MCELALPRMSQVCHTFTLIVLCLLLTFLSSNKLASASKSLMTCSALRRVTEERCLPSFSNVLPPSDTANVSRNNSISKQLWYQMSSARTWQPRPWKKKNAVFQNLLGEANDCFFPTKIPEPQRKNVTCLNIKCKRKKKKSEKSFVDRNLLPD